MTTPDIAPLPERVFEQLSQVSTATLATQLYRRGIRQPFLVGVSPVGTGFDGFVGEAFTMRFIPAREDVDPLGDPYRTGNVLQWQAVESIGERQVIVVDSRNDISAASAGDMLITRARERGAAGFVTDGALRDGEAIAALDFPAYCRANTATTRPASFHVADLQVPVGCAGVAVYPGDVLVGDRNGVIVVPRALAAEISGPSLEQERLEHWLNEQVAAGAELWGTYPPNEETLARYDEYRRTRFPTDTGSLDRASAFPTTDSNDNQEVTA
ncbi:ribonuclease activity regulator RraA [Brevibacterium sediminis]|uniref:Putative 4-hydroxy-4-methyl-2-oxoglutarate aldolase n=1 Tax=Brevibacterium sediminis TaxID=1857024 RepID=A0ABQ1M8Y4_9MICO|nr:ribonuclease activity regulator RraA [Brevibacterium sediminis]GGC36696.1 ribonuclease activity regulator RraA [Brevibacterium sediminis]